MLATQFDQLVKQRRSVRQYDNEAEFDETAVARSLERAVLAPNSSNMQLWAFYRVKSEAVKLKMAEACMGQSAARTANELVVFVTKQSLWRQHAKWNLAQLTGNKNDVNSKRYKRGIQYYSHLVPLFYRNDWLGINTLLRTIISTFIGFKKPTMRFNTHADQRIVCHKSVALAAQTFMLSMVAEGFDTCPMEGFDKHLVKKILNLGDSDEVSMVVACGKGKAEGIYSERLRVPNEQVIFIV